MALGTRYAVGPDVFAYAIIDPQTAPAIINGSDAWAIAAPGRILGWDGLPPHFI